MRRCCGFRDHFTGESKLAMLKISAKWRTSRVIWLYLLGLVHWLFFLFLIYPTGKEVFHTLSSGSNGDHGGVLIFEDGGDRALLRISPLDWFEAKVFDAHDMYREMNCVSLMKQAMVEGVIPYHVPILAEHLGHGTRFMGLPVWSISPQFVLLAFMSPIAFYTFNVLFMYSVGFLGCVLLGRYLDLDEIAFAFLYLLFNFNGRFVGHMTVFGPSQLGYFMLPFVLLIVLKVGDQEGPRFGFNAREAVYLGFALAAMIYQGTLHMFCQTVCFFMLWAVVNIRRWRFSLLTMLSMGLLAMARLLPTYITHGGKGNSTRWSGYGSIDLVVEAFVVLQTHIGVPHYTWWELSYYIGIFGFLGICFFGLWAPIANESWCARKWHGLLVPAAVMVVLSIGPIKHAVVPSWVPFFNVEGRPMFFLLIPFLLAIVIAASNIAGYSRRNGHTKRYQCLLLVWVGAIGLQLFNHSRFWRSHRVENEFWWIIDNEIFTPPGIIVPHIPYTIGNDMTDTVYINAVWLGCTVSVLALLALGTWLVLDGKKRVAISE